MLKLNKIRIKELQPREFVENLNLLSDTSLFYTFHFFIFNEKIVILGETEEMNE